MSEHATLQDYFSYTGKGNIDLTVLALFSSFLGLLTHLYCQRFEPTALGFLSFVSFLDVLALAYFAWTGVRTETTVWLITAANASFWSSLWYLWPPSSFWRPWLSELTKFSLSIATYRLLLSPLRRFPGPIWARLTKAAAVYEAFNGYTHLWLEDLHEKYGDVVRVGPNELSYRSVESLPEIHGARSAKIAKGPWYDGIPDQPADSMASVRDLAEHKLRRRIWDRGFSPKALLGYEARILQHVNVMSKQIRARTGQVLNFSDWCDFFAFDVMGDLGFGEDFGMLLEAKPHPYMVFMHHALRMLSIFSHIPWFKQLIPYLPMDAQAKRDSQTFFKISDERFQHRREKGTDRDDIFSYLLSGNEGQRQLTDAQLASDAAVIIVGGSDTTSVCLTFLFYYLCKNPHTLQTLQEEVDALWDGVKPQNGALWAQAKYLNGVINESLRLYPPGPNGMQRTTPKGGCFIDGQYLPEGTQLSVHGWSMHRDPRYFSHATEFIPERWVDEERPADYHHDTRAFIPFNLGQYACIGKGLALLEMRLVVAELVKRFDITLDDSHDEKAFQQAVRSNLSLLKGRLPLIFTERMTQ
ncbi:hypothetical protein CLAIMM_03051 [Cladophialophora immunda]|nr:hypothetical protein CLAIMM_03051 [Cladophialophora immunda]